METITQRNVGGGMAPSFRADLLSREVHRQVIGFRNSRGSLIQRQRKRLVRQIGEFKGLLFNEETQSAQTSLLSLTAQTTFGFAGRLTLDSLTGADTEANLWDFSYSQTTQAPTYDSVETYAFGFTVRELNRQFRLNYSSGIYARGTLVVTCATGELFNSGGLYYKLSNSYFFTVPQGVDRITVTVTAEPETISFLNSTTNYLPSWTYNLNTV